MRRRQRILLIACVALFGAPAPTATAADFTWGGVEQLSAAGAGSELPQVAIADDGRAIAVWRAHYGGTCRRERLWASYKTRGGSFSAPEAISQASGIECTNTVGGHVGRHFRLRMNRAGDAVVVYLKTRQDGQASLAATYKRRSAARFDINGEQFLDNGGSWFEPEVALDEDGNATVMYHGQPYPFGTAPDRRSVYRWGSRAAGASSWSIAGLQIFAHSLSNENQVYDYNETAGALATDERGNLLAAAAQQERDNGAVRRQGMRLASKGPTGTAWSQGNSFDDTAIADRDADGTSVAASSNGSVAAWREARTVLAVARGPSAAVNDTGLPDPPDRPKFGVDPTGNILGVFAQSGNLGAAFQGVGSSTWERDVIGAAVPGHGFYTERSDPDLSVGRSAIALTAFEEQCVSPNHPVCPAGSPNDDHVVRAAIRQSGAKTKFDAPTTISAVSDLEVDVSDKRGSGPKVAFNSEGEGVAVWARTGSESDYVVQAAQVTPRGPTPSGVVIPPAPPPPPPPPPIPSEIALARPLDRGDAIVLTAKVDGPVTALEWRFGTKNEPKIVATAGANGQVPRSIRLRHPDRSFAATVIAYGPGGARVFRRTLVQPKDPTSGSAAVVLRGLDRANASGVFAVGDAAGLIGGASASRASRRAGGPRVKASASCSPISIFSGQQKVSGCFKPVETLADIPAREKGAVKQLADSLKLDETKTELMQEATKLTDSYVSQGKALLNDKFPVTPSQASSLVSMPQADTLFSAKADLPVGGASYSPSNGFNLKLDPAKATIPLGKLPKPPKLPSLAGLEIVGDWDVNLDKQEAKIKASVKLPPSITKAGVQISNQVNLRATADRVIVDEVRVGPVDVNIKALKVDKFQIAYKREPNQWDGQGKACLIGTACLDMIPPNGGITIKNGDLERAGASLIFPQPGLPLWSGVNLERVGFGLGLRPTRIFGNARVGVAQFIKLDGRIFVALPTSAEPFVMNRDEVGNDYPPHLYGSRFHRFTFGASAAALVDVPVIGETKLGSAYVVYEYPGYLAFGGGYDATVLDLVGIRGGIAAEADADQGVFDIHGEVKACLYLAGLDLCSGATGHVSRGRGGTGGGGACVDLGLVTVGGGVKWKDLGDPYIWPIDGCKWSPFRIQVRQSAAAARKKGKGPKASATQLVRGRVSRAVLARESQVGVSQAGKYTIKVEKDKPSPVLRLDGIGTAPAIRVSGPGGVLEAPAGKGFVKTPDNKMRIMRYQGRLAKITSIGFQKADPGTYTVQVLPGSSPVVAVRQATDPPDAKVKGKVAGKGRNRVFTYEVARRPSQKVVFSEITASGASQVIGSTAGGKGRIRFRSAPGSGRRTIIAQFNLDGISAERKRVTTFKPQSPVMARPRGVKLSRKGARLRVSWKRVSGATAYEVAVAPSSRRMVFARTRGRRATLKVPAWDKGRVTVRAVDDLRQSPPAGRGFKAIARRPSAFRSFPRCKVAKKKINCGKSKAKAKKKAKSKSKAKKKPSRKR